MISTTDVIAKSQELNNDPREVRRELKRIASVKCRLKKMPGRSSFAEDMTKTLQIEELLKNVLQYLEGPKKNVNTLTQEEVDQMDYDEVCKAIRAIQSKKTNTKWLTMTPGETAEYKEACRIEDMLQARKALVKPVADENIRKSDIQKAIDTLRICTDITVEDCLAYFENLLKGDDSDDDTRIS